LITGGIYTIKAKLPDHDSRKEELRRRLLLSSTSLYSEVILKGNDYRLKYA